MSFPTLHIQAFLVKVMMMQKKTRQWLPNPRDLLEVYWCSKINALCVNICGGVRGRIAQKSEPII